MAKKKHYLIVDSETTIDATVADFGAVIVDRHGEVFNQCAVLIRGHYGEKELFYDANSSDEIWTKRGLEKRKANYEKMLREGSRMLASVSAINRWLEKANERFNPELTAYNLAFDVDKARNTAIDLDMFSDRFCLWHAASGVFAGRKDFKKFVLANHLFNPPTALGNMTFKTNAEVMAQYIIGSQLPPEPHTALEDITGYELPILIRLLRVKKWREKMRAYNWKEWQVRDHYQAK